MNIIPENDQLSAVNETFPDIVARFDTQQRHLYVSPSLESFTGRRASEWIGKTNEELGMPKDNCLQWRQFFERVLSEKITLEMDCEYEGPRKRHLLHSVATPEFNSNGEVSGIFCITRDITTLMERKRELDELTTRIAEQRRNMIHLSQMKALAEMSAGINHEINNPLTAIMGQILILTQKLADKTFTPEDIQSRLSVIQQNSERIASVVEGLRMFTNTRPSDKRPLTLELLVQKTLLLCQEKIQKRGIKISVDVASEFSFFGHEASLMQVIYSLLLNSMEAIENLDERWINVHVRELPGEWRLNIVDSGPGIKAELVEKIFHPFFTTKKLASGLGLGLSIAREIMLEHGGNLFYQNCDGNTQFVLVFPK